MFRLERIVTLVIFIFFLKRVGAFYWLYNENEANSSQADVAYSFSLILVLLDGFLNLHSKNVTRDQFLPWTPVIVAGSQPRNKSLYV